MSLSLSAGPLFRPRPFFYPEENLDVFAPRPSSEGALPSVAEAGPASAAPQATPGAADEAQSPSAAVRYPPYETVPNTNPSKTPNLLKAAADGRFVTIAPVGGWRGRVLMSLERASQRSCGARVRQQRRAPLGTAVRRWSAAARLP